MGPSTRPGTTLRKNFARSCYAPPRDGEGEDVTADQTTAEQKTKQQTQKPNPAMKTSRKNIARIGTAASHAVNRTLILLQENSSGESYMTDVLPAGPVRTAADAIIDSVVENG